MKKQMKKQLMSELGFTLVEVMIAVAILGTLSLAVMKLTDQMTKGEKAFTQRSSLNDVKMMSQYALKNGAACLKTLGSGATAPSVPYVNLPAPTAIFKDATTPLFSVGTIFGSNTRGTLKILELKHGGYSGAGPTASENIEITVKTGDPDDTRNPRYDITNTGATPPQIKNVMVIRFPVFLVINGGLITDCYENQNAYVSAACTQLNGQMNGSFCQKINVGAGAVDSLQTESVVVTGNAKVTGATALNGAVTAGSTLGVTGAVTAGSTLAVTGASTLTGAVTAGSTLGVTGTSTLTGAVTASNGVTVSSGNITVTTGSITTSASSGNVNVGGTVFINNPAYTYNGFDDTKAATVAYVKTQIAKTLAPDLGTAATIISDILSASPSSAAFSITSSTICARTRVNGIVGSWNGTYCDYTTPTPCGLTLGTRCSGTYYLTSLDVSGSIQATGNINSNTGVCVGGVCATTFAKQDCGIGWAVRGIFHGGVFCTRTYP